MNITVNKKNHDLQLIPWNLSVLVHPVDKVINKDMFSV